MRIVAAGATHAYGGVHEFFVKQRFVMAYVAQVGLFGGKPLRDLRCYFMRNVSGIDGSVAGGTTHGNGCMNAFSFGKFLVALKAIDLCR